MNPPVVSVIVAVVDASEWSVIGVESVLDQRLHVGELEVIVVAAGIAVDAARRLGGRVRVVADPAGNPLNAGLDQARGRYVYFMRPGDRLHPDHLSRLVDLAERARSDVAVPEAADDDCGFRRPATDRARVSLFDSDLYDDLEPRKLFRRGFLAEWGLRFDDGDPAIARRSFVARALVHARTISVATGMDVPLPPPVPRRCAADAARSIAEIDRLALFLAQNLEPGDRRDRLVRRHVAADVLTEAVAATWNDADETGRAALAEAAGAFLRRWLTSGVRDALHPAHRLLAAALLADAPDHAAVSDAVRTGRVGDAHDVHIEDGRIFAMLPGFGCGGDDSAYVIAGPTPRHGLSVARFDGGTLRLAGFAYLPFVDTPGQTVTVLVRDADGVDVARVPTEWTSTPDLTVRHGTGRRDYSHAGFVGEIDLAELADAARDASPPLSLHVEVAAHGVVGVAPLGTRRVRGLTLPQSCRLVGAATTAALVRAGADSDGALRLDVSPRLAERVAVLIGREATGTGLTATIRGDLVNLPEATTAELALTGDDAARYIPGLLERGDSGYLFTAKLPPPRLFLGRGVWSLGVRLRWPDGSWTVPVRDIDGAPVTMTGRPSFSALLARLAGREAA